MISRAFHVGLYLAAAAFAAITSWYFSAFTADDAFIVARYAVNARDVGEWAFNPGEPVSALTSPLHGLWLNSLALLVSDPLTLYKASALIAVTASAAILLISYGLERDEAVPMAALLVAPSLILWTFAGLETPLLAAIVMGMAALYTQIRTGCPRLFLLAALAGAAVITRYDAVLFAGPVLLAALIQTSVSRKNKLVAVTIAAAPPSLWFVYAWLQYGSVLPTSFYIKTPTAAVDVIRVNARYMTEHLLIAGVGIMAAYAIARAVGAGNMRRKLVEECQARWGLHAALLLVLVYGATMATVHMMFAFRHFVPYLGATALALAHFAAPAGALRSARLSSRLSYYGAGTAAVLMLLVHALHAEAMYNRSLQGLGTFGEYGEQGVAGYTRDYIPAMMGNAADVKAHWSTLAQGRQPRVWTFAAGALPYAYREAYIFEALVSYRHRCPAAEDGTRADGRVWRAHADYIHAFTRHGSLPRLLSPVRAKDVRLVSERPLHFNGRDERLLVYYNPAPFPNVLPPRIDGPCSNVSEERR